MSEPKRFRGLKRDHRNLPIPFLMMPDSQITTDGRKFKRCALEKVCMICGQKLDNKKWFIGGGITIRNRMFTDPAMHEECARYSLHTCPFLSRSDMKYRKKYDEDTTVAPYSTTTRSDTQILSRTNGYRVVIFRGHPYVWANRWDYLEHWRNGKKVQTPPGMSAEELAVIPGVLDPGGDFEKDWNPLR